ncbi:pantetheine-phosphate adenylyltransferase [Olsenella sp. Marseille-P4559]|uniref:pantetheine-phosphate adenylyltransferase n=1 Tax=Olsenella sp. Marseille-P4559 TaxID=2364795 RepID=UPI00210FEA76|nr:pantetheine-phosphate adenylyltransferase [Olsenella sp. Marseille-P4559]
MASNLCTHVVVPGTFDPVTLGHMDVIRRARKLFPRVTVAVAESRHKRDTGTEFTLEERVDMLKGALLDDGMEDGVEVVPFCGLLVDFCKKQGAGGVVKGLRATTDFEYELQQADLNTYMAPDLESIFVMSNPQYGYVSSSVVREIAAMGGDVDFLVPPNVAVCLRAHYA